MSAKKEKSWQDKIVAYALKNAIEHEGKAQEGAVIAGLFHEGLKQEEVKIVVNDIKKVVAEVNRLGLDKQKQEFEKLKGVTSKRKERKGLPTLPQAKKGKVIMRFAPSPSGPLHVGHAATACISFLYVKKYGGKFYIRIEDTNPENIYKPAYKMLKDEAKWLFNNKAQIVIQSQRMKLYYQYAKDLIEKEKAYVCSCSQKKMQELRRKGKECSCRQFPLDEQTKRWEKMLKKGKGAYKEGDAVLRFKGDMQDKNPAFRDFPLARIVEKSHPLQGKKYRVWPLMNLAVAVDDIEQKMTHIIRAKEHRDNAKRQEMIFNVFDKKYPWAAYLGRWHFKDMVLSTTKMRKAIEAGEYKGWEDERLPTIASLRKRGYKKEAFWKFSEQVGLSETDKVIDKKEYFRLLDYFNKK